MVNRTKRIFDRKTFGQNVAKFREQRGMTQEQLAKLCSRTESHIGQIERGEKGASLSLAYVLADILGVNVDDLLDGTDDSNHAQ